MNIAIDNRAETIFLRAFHSIPPVRTFFIVAFRATNHKWRSSLNADDKCHLNGRMVGITSVSRESYGISTRACAVELQLGGNNVFVR